MVVGVSVFELHVPAARSLKEKRQVVKSLIDRIHQRFRVSIVETGYHDLHQRSEISIAAVTLSEGEGLRLMDAIRSMIDAEPRATLTHWNPELMEGME